MQTDNPAAPADAVRQALEGYTDPWIERTLGELKAIEALQLDGDAVRAVVRLPVPVAGYTSPFHPAAAAALTLAASVW